jgi:hypothetical protein
MSKFDTPTKHWKRSKTLQFFTAILVMGGIDLIVQFLQGTADWRNFAILVISMVGIGLRIVTRHELINP